MSNVTEKFLRYVVLDTQSADGAATVPSTEKQFDLARLLTEELRAMGASDVRLDEQHCYVYASIPASPGLENLPALGFVAHMDTSDAVSGRNVHPQIIQNYDGSDVALGQSGLTLSPRDYPALANYKGQTLITTDGNTLLGADDKAGVAEIVAMAEALLRNPAFPHGPIRIGFTPDEEVGAGVDFFDVAGFDAAYAYTVDGGPLGAINYENFNAASATVAVHGVSIHPGSAKGKMVNALLVAMELQSLLPVFEDPAATEHYEGFYHLTNMQGGCDSAEMSYIIRDHDQAKFEAKKAFFQQAVDFLNMKYGAGTVMVDIRDSYCNMLSVIEANLHLIDTAVAAMEALGIVPIIEPIRGGTDGARLSFMGLPCPNLCTGGHNFHGRYEYITAESMERTVELLLEIVRRYAEAR